MTKKTAYIITILLIAMAILGRVIPHAPNVTPTTAIALFSAAYLGVRYSALIFFISMIVADFFIGAYDWRIMLSVYLSFAAASFIGLWIGRRKNPSRIFCGVLASSVLFYIVTNFAVWLFGDMYAHTFSGLIASYTMAIPFFKNSLAGDVMYSALLFGACEAALYMLNGSKMRRVPFPAE